MQVQTTLPFILMMKRMADFGLQLLQLQKPSPMVELLSLLPTNFQQQSVP